MKLGPLKEWSWWTDSNPRPADYKSAALPAELHQQVSRGYEHWHAYILSQVEVSSADDFCELERLMCLADYSA